MTAPQGAVAGTYADHLRPFLPYLPLALIPRKCLERILGVAQRLPSALGVGPFMLECALDRRRGADFSVGAFAARGDQAAVARPGATALAASADDAAWTRVREFARRWGDASSPLCAAIDEVWLEFDVCLTRDTLDTSPNVFIGVGGRRPRDPGTRRRLTDVAAYAFAALEGRPLSTARLTALTDCLADLPSGARVLFFGALAPRGGDAIRVVTDGSSVTATTQWLRRRGVEAPPVADLLDLTDRHWLAIDVDTTGVRDRIGLDLYCTGTGAWDGLLECLVQLGASTPGKRQALLDAAALSTDGVEDPAWPEHIRAASMIFGPAGLDVLNTSIHHIKVVLRSDAPLEAKGYLCGAYKSSATIGGRERN